MVLFVNINFKRGLNMKVLFVCTGNTCRSPMAEGFYNKLYGGGAKSAGISAIDGYPPSFNAVAAMKTYGIDISQHRSTMLLPDDIKESDQVFAMDESHAVILKKYFPEYSDKIHLLGKGISDPFGSDLETYLKCADEIYGYISKLEIS